jgi:aminopeptidase N
MWFGDLVTMRWFDDVWMKEVFANFMAAKIVQPSFPDVDHALRFFQAHHPTAYGVDRTPGANPIRQELPNLREAGSLYGAIIYQKAPVVMRQLEALVGDSIFREGMRRYLGAHSYANATWPDLVAVLDDLTPMDVRAWSQAWVEEAGRPVVTATWAGDSLVLTQRDDWAERTKRFAATEDARTLRWPQRITTLLVWPDRLEQLTVDLRAESGVAKLATAPAGAPLLMLPGVDGMSYGRFPLGDATRSSLLTRAALLNTPLQRAVAWQALYEEMLDERVPPDALLSAALSAVGSERDELVQSQLAGLIRTTYWRFLTDSARRANASLVEQAFWSALAAAPTPGRQGSLFGSIISVTLTDSGMARLERIWRKREVPSGFPVSESQFIAMAEGLAIRGHPDASAILDEQETRITNPDRRARQRFVRPALSADSAARDSVFRSFASVEHRRRESWVLDAMSAMHHPLRARASVGQLEAALALAGEIQATGDIFFPLRWLNATLDGHNSADAATIAAAFLDRNRALAPKLRGKILQATDDLFRAARITSNWR